MLRRFLRDSAIYSISAALSRGVAIIMIPLYTRFLHPSEYGVLDLLMITATLFNYLILLEISQGLARVYSEAESSLAKIQCISSAAWFAIAAYSIFAIFGFTFAASLAEVILNSAELINAVRVMILAIIFNGVFFLLQDLLRWQLQPRKHALGSIIYSVVSASSGAFAVVILKTGVIGILAGQVVGAIIGLLVTCICGAAKYWKFQFNLSIWFEMLRYSAPQVISSFAAFSALYIDRFFIKEMLGVEEVGIYGVGARIASLVALLMAGFQSGYIPLVFQNHSSSETPPQMARVFRFFLVGAFLIVTLLAGYSKELLSVFTTEQYFSAWFTVPILASAMLLANMYIFVPGVFIAKRTGFVAILNVSTVMINVILILLFLPLFGIAGAAIAVLAGSLFNFLVYILLNKRFYPIPFNWNRILLGIIVGVLFATSLMLLQNISGYFVFMLKTIIFFIGALILLFTLLETSELKLLAFKIGWQ